MIYTYGDSFTYGDCEETGRVESPFPKLLATHFNSPVRNLGCSGASLSDIHVRLAADILDFKKGDLVIIGKTSPDRVQVPNFGESELKLWANAFFSEVSYSRSYPYFTSNRWLRGFPISDPDYLSKAIEEYFNKIQWDILESSSNSQFLKEFIPLYVIYNNSLKLNKEHFYDKVFYNLGYKLASKGIDVIIWDYKMWDLIGVDGNLCKCKHWNQKGHVMFTELLTYFLKTRSSKYEILLDSEKIFNNY